MEEIHEQTYTKITLDIHSEHPISTQKIIDAIENAYSVDVHSISKVYARIDINNKHDAQ